MAGKMLSAVVLSVALAFSPALVMAEDGTVEKGSVSRTGTGVAADQVQVAAAFAALSDLEKGLAAALLAGGLGAALYFLLSGDGDGPGATATQTN